MHYTKWTLGTERHFGFEYIMLPLNMIYQFGFISNPTWALFTLVNQWRFYRKSSIARGIYLNFYYHRQIQEWGCHLKTLQSILSIKSATWVLYLNQRWIKSHSSTEHCGGLHCDVYKHIIPHNGNSEKCLELKEKNPKLLLSSPGLNLIKPRGHIIIGWKNSTNTKWKWFTNHEKWPSVKI